MLNFCHPQDEDGNPLETEYGLSTYKDHQTFTIQVKYWYLWFVQMASLLVEFLQWHSTLFFACRKCQKKPLQDSCLVQQTSFLIMTWQINARCVMNCHLFFKKRSITFIKVLRSVGSLLLNAAQYLNCPWGEISIPHKLGFSEMSPPQSPLPSCVLVLNLILINVFIIFFILIVIYSVWQNNKIK